MIATTGTRGGSADRPGPPIEGGDLDAYLAEGGFDVETEAFIADLARDGVARIDLGDDAPAVCDAAVAQTSRWLDKAGIARVQDAWRQAPAVRALATHPKVLRLLGAAYGRAAVPIQSLNFKHGTQQPLHSDCIHFSSQPERFMCGVWVALEDIHPDAGPLTYRPGSHRLPIMTMQAAGLNAGVATSADYDRLYVPAIAAEADAFPAREAVLKKGQAFVWAANLIHGGAPILDPVRTRQSQVTHYYFEGCRYYAPLLSSDEAPRMRLPSNAVTGGWTWPQADGRRTPLSWRTLVDAAYLRLFRQPYASA
jgi:hypothetical protein